MTGSELVDRLVRRYGKGDRPLLRMALYQRLGDLVDDEELGEKRLFVIASVIDDARQRTRPARYFAWVVMRRLMDRGLLPHRMAVLEEGGEVVSSGEASYPATRVS